MFHRPSSNASFFGFYSNIGLLGSGHVLMFLFIIFFFFIILMVFFFPFPFNTSLSRCRLPKPIFLPRRRLRLYTILNTKIIYRNNNPSLFFFLVYFLIYSLLTGIWCLCACRPPSWICPFFAFENEKSICLINQTRWWDEEEVRKVRKWRSEEISCLTYFQWKTAFC